MKNKYGKGGSIKLMKNGGDKMLMRMGGDIDMSEPMEMRMQGKMKYGGSKKNMKKPNKSGYRGKSKRDMYE